MTAEQAERETAVYRLFDHSGVLLYVGMTNDIATRLREHAIGREWWADVDVSRTLVTAYDTRAEAANAERVAIELLRPLHACATGRPRGVLSDETLNDLADMKNDPEYLNNLYRKTVVAALDEGSFSEVSKATGLSTNTLQRWKREAGK